jgi:hypothetical protein
MQSFNVQNLMQVDDVSRVLCMFKAINVDNGFFSKKFLLTIG